MSMPHGSSTGIAARDAMQTTMKPTSSRNFVRLSSSDITSDRDGAPAAPTASGAPARASAHQHGAQQRQAGPSGRWRPAHAAAAPAPATAAGAGAPGAGAAAARSGATAGSGATARSCAAGRAAVGRKGEAAEQPDARRAERLALAVIIHETISVGDAGRVDLARVGAHRAARALRADVAAAGGVTRTILVDVASRRLRLGSARSQQAHQPKNKRQSNRGSACVHLEKPPVSAADYHG